MGAGIAIAGGQEVTISGADCSGVNEFWQAKFSGAPAQPYAIAVSGLVSDVTVTGCHLPYNATGGVLVAQVGEAVPEDVFIRDCNAGHYSSYSVAMNIVSSAVNVQITNCAGYNDQAVRFITTVPTGTFYNTTFGYYGPITFYVWGASGVTVEIGTLTTGLGTGAYSLPCNVSATIAHSGPSPSFGVIGM